MKRISVLCWIASMTIHTFATTSTTTVGNGDEGRDLENLTPIESGIVFETRFEAVKRMKALNVAGMPGLLTSA